MKNQSGSQHLPIILALFFGAAVVVTIFGYMLWPKDEEIGSNSTVVLNTNSTNSNANSNVNTAANTNSGTNSNTNTAAPTNTNTAIDPTVGWKTYTNTKHKYSVQYPADWEALYGATADAPGFRPLTMRSDFQWGIVVHDATKKTVEEIIIEGGSQFSDRKETRTNITVGGVTAIKATITTNQFANWQLELVVVLKNGKIYELSNGAIIDPAFTSFYQTFAFTN